MNEQKKQIKSLMARVRYRHRADLPARRFPKSCWDTADYVRQYHALNQNGRAPFRPEDIRIGGAA